MMSATAFTTGIPANALPVRSRFAVPAAIPNAAMKHSAGHSRLNAELTKTA